MTQSRSGPKRLATLVGAVALIVAACSGSAATPAPPSAAPSAAATDAPAPSATEAPTPLVTPAPIANDQPGPNGGVVVRWFVGLGAGGQPQQIAAQTTFVADYNNSQKDVYISLEIYDNKVAANILKTQIAAGNAPDIIGPVGVEGLNLFIDQLADLQPQIDSTGYDMSKYPPALADFFKIGKGGSTIGVPFGTYPSFLWYNKKLFDEAKLAVPADQGRRPVRGQAVGHGRRSRARHEAHRRQERQRRHQRGLRSDQRRPVGLRLPVGRQRARPPRPPCSAPARSSPPTARPRRSPTPCGPVSTGSTTASGRTTSSPTRTRSTATCWPRATRSSPATSR